MHWPNAMTHLVKTPESSSVSSVICPITASTRSHSSWPQLILFWVVDWSKYDFSKYEHSLGPRALDPSKFWLSGWSTSWDVEALSNWCSGYYMLERIVILLSVHFLLKLWFKRKVGVEGGEGGQFWDKAPTVLFLNWCVTDWPMWKIRACQVKVCNQPNKWFKIPITLID